MKQEKEIRLDFLANFPQNHKANALLHSQNVPNPNTLDSAYLSQLSQDSKNLALLFHKTHAHSFNYTSSDFFTLFSILQTHHFHIILSVSLHQQSLYAAKVSKGIKLISPNQQGVIQSIPPLPNEKNLAFFLPFVNQDILTTNPIESLLEVILHTYPNAFIFLDISLLASVLDSTQLKRLSTLSHPQILFLCNAESIGLSRPSGFILSSFNKLENNHILDEFLQLQLLRPNLYKAAYIALQDILQSLKPKDSKNEFYTKLKNLLGENLSLFAPLESTLPNALPLRFSHIKARLLLQALSVEGIFAINGQDCLFGNAKPSFVLASQGYDEPSTRELLSISYNDEIKLDSITQRLSNAYLQLTQF